MHRGKLQPSQWHSGSVLHGVLLESTFWPFFGSKRWPYSMQPHSIGLTMSVMEYYVPAAVGQIFYLVLIMLVLASKLPALTQGGGSDLGQQKCSEDVLGGG